MAGKIMRLKTSTQIRFALTLPDCTRSWTYGKRRYIEFSSRSAHDSAKIAIKRRYPKAFDENKRYMGTNTAMSLGWQRPKPRGTRLGTKPWIVALRCNARYDDFDYILAMEIPENSYGLVPFAATKNQYKANELVRWFASLDPSFPVPSAQQRRAGHNIVWRISDNVAKQMVWRWRGPV